MLIADDQAMVRSGFRWILDNEPDIEVVGEADDGLIAVDLARRLLPAVVVMDIRMPRLDGIEATRRILASPVQKAQVLIVTTFDADESVYRALRAGAAGFLLKTAPSDQLVDGVRLVASGEGLLSPSITKRLIEQFAARSEPVSTNSAIDALTARELEVLRQVASGQSNREIAERLSVTQATVKAHMSSLLSKLDLRDRVQAVVFAYESGLVGKGRAEARPANKRRWRRLRRWLRDCRAVLRAAAVVRREPCSANFFGSMFKPIGRWGNEISSPFHIPRGGGSDDSVESGY